VSEVVKATLSEISDIVFSWPMAAAALLFLASAFVVASARR